MRRTIMQRLRDQAPPGAGASHYPSAGRPMPRALASRPPNEFGRLRTWGVQQSNLQPLACRPATRGPAPSTTVHETCTDQGRYSTDVQYRPNRSRRVCRQTGCQERVPIWRGGRSGGRREPLLACDFRRVLRTELARDDASPRPTSTDDVGPLVVEKSTQRCIGRHRTRAGVRTWLVRDLDGIGADGAPCRQTVTH